MVQLGSLRPNLIQCPRESLPEMKARSLPPPECDDAEARSSDEEIFQQVPSSKPCICVIGVGFVGESLLKQFSSAFDCIGFDISEERVSSLSQRLKYLKNVVVTSDPIKLASASHFFICVPTPLRQDNSVNLDCVVLALGTILQYARRGCCIVIESSVPVGTTRKILGAYKDFFHCGVSPERVDPGRTHPQPKEIPKLVAGLTPVALKHIYATYSEVYQVVVPVSKPEVAEMTKLFENCYRMVNIAYVNEMSDACHQQGIDPHEMIGAASTKPFGFQAFHPGLGVGGNCLPVNPWYLLSNNKRLPILERATKLMRGRPHRMAWKFHARCKAEHASKPSATAAAKPRILIVGICFKDGYSDTSDSPGLSFARKLKDLGCSRLAFFDPLVQSHQAEGLERLENEDWNCKYLDEHFDGIAICNKLDCNSMSVMNMLQRSIVQSYV